MKLTTASSCCRVSFQPSWEPAEGLPAVALSRLGQAVSLTIAGMAMLRLILWELIEKLQRCRMTASPCRTEQKPEMKGHRESSSWCFSSPFPKSGRGRRLQCVWGGETETGQVLLCRWLVDTCPPGGEGLRNLLGIIT